MNKIEHSAPIWTANHHFLQSKEHTWQPMMSNNEQRTILLKIIVLIENWMGNWNIDCLKWGEDKGMKGWITSLVEFVLTLNMNMSEAKGMSSLQLFISRFFWWIWGRKDGEGAAILSSPHHLSCFFFLLFDAVITEQGLLQLQGLEARVIYS